MITHGFSAEVKWENIYIHGEDYSDIIMGCMRTAQGKVAKMVIKHFSLISFPQIPFLNLKSSGSYYSVNFSGLTMM